VDERKLYQTFLGAKNSIQEYTLGLKIVLFDFETGKWSDLIENMTLDFPSWSKDGQYVYFLHSPENLAVLRIRVRDRKIEQVADLKGFVPTGWWGKWLGTISRAHEHNFRHNIRFHTSTLALWEPRDG
jgi:hypothetical protein